MLLSCYYEFADAKQEGNGFDLAMGCSVITRFCLSIVDRVLEVMLSLVMYFLGS